MSARPTVLFVIPVYNQLDYTRQCLDSLNRDGVSGRDVLVVDNSSADGTREFLAARPDLRVISNETNRGCSAAWNQGVEAALAAGADWIIVINNDVVVATGFRDGMLDFATRAGCDIVSPAMAEGELDYDLHAFARDYVGRMAGASRPGVASGVCFMVKRSVFERAGLFDTQLGLAGYEDEDFFRRAQRAGFRIATTGQAYLHHYGSVTQKSVKANLGVPGKARLGNREYFRRKHGLHWAKRRAEKSWNAIRTAYWKWRERRHSAFTLRLRRRNGAWQRR